MRRLWAVAVALYCLVAAPHADATVLTATRSVQYSPGSPTSVFTVTYPFLSASHLRVTKTTIATETSVVLTEGTDYSVRLPVGSTQGTVTTTVPVSSTHRITIERVVPATQATSFRTQGTFNPGSHEDAFDKLTMLVQQLADGSAVDSDIATAIATHEGASDPHPNYALLPGRSGGQQLRGGTGSGQGLTLSSTAHPTKGKIFLGSSSAYDEVNLRLGLGTTSPSYTLEVNGDALFYDISGTHKDTHIVAGGIYKAAADGILMLSSGTVSDFTTSARIALYGPSAAGFPADINISADDIRFTDPSGDIVVTLDTGDGSGSDSVLTTQNIVVGSTYSLQSPTVQGSSSGGGDLTLSSTENVTKGNIYLGASSTYDEANTRLGIGTITPSQTMEVVGDASFRRPYRDSAGPEVALGDDPADCNAIVGFSASVGSVFLAEPGYGVAGTCQITLVYTGADGNGDITIAPSAGGRIVGSCIGPGGFVTFSGVADKDVLQTKATSNRGDYITLASMDDGDASWYVVGCVGDWESEP